MQGPIEVSTLIGARFSAARDVLADDPAAVFRDGAKTDADHDPSVHTAPGDVGAGASVHQDVLVQLGSVRSSETAVVIPVRWQAAGRAWLLPTFTGQLAATETAAATLLRLHGSYTVPLGVIGRLADAVGGWRLVRRSLHALVARVGHQLQTEVESRSMSPTDDAVANEGQRSEIYIG
jgi:hypothetical protein